MGLTRDRMVEVVERYYEACNAADRAGMIACFAPDAKHYFPAGAPQGTFDGAAAIADGWCRAVATLGSQWTIDQLTVDERAQRACIEWTHFKTRAGIHLRGAEIVEFAPDGRIAEIRAFYAAPAQPAPQVTHELGDVEYAARGYPMEAPTAPVAS